MDVNVDVAILKNQIRLLKDSVKRLNLLYKELNEKYQNMSGWNDMKSQEAKQIVTACGRDIKKMENAINEIVNRLEKMLQPLLEYENVNLYSGNLGDTEASLGKNSRETAERGIAGLIQSLFEKRNHETARQFGNGLYVVRDTLNSERYYVSGDNTGSFMSYWENAGSYTEVPNEDANQIIYVRACDIEGIHLSSREVDDVEGFWGRRTGGTQETFSGIASQISQVRGLLDSGMDYADIRMTHPELSDCVGIYFESAPDVCSLEDFYVFNSNGRHRIMAARSIDAVIPVRVRGSYIRTDES